MVIMMCPCRFILGDRCATLLNDADDGKAMQVLEQGYMEISVLSSQFGYETKIVLKN